MTRNSEPYSRISELLTNTIAEKVSHLPTEDREDLLKILVNAEHAQHSELYGFYNSTLLCLLCALCEYRGTCQSGTLYDNLTKIIDLAITYLLPRRNRCISKDCILPLLHVTMTYSTPAPFAGISPPTPTSRINWYSSSLAHSARLCGNKYIIT